MTTESSSDGPTKGNTLGSLGLIIVAAGNATRMMGVDKIFVPVMGVPLIAYSIEALASSPLVGSFVLVLASRNVAAGERLAAERGWPKLAAVCEGGARRQDSVKLGLDKLPPCSWVAVHDGARPAPGPGILERGIKAAQQTGASVAAVPAKDTVKVVSDSGVVESTPPRSSLWMVQTPQVFAYEILEAAHRDCEETFTDDAAMVESMGYKVRVFEGSYANLKVTTPEDLAMVEAALKAGTAETAHAALHGGTTSR